MSEVNRFAISDVRNRPRQARWPLLIAVIFYQAFSRETHHFGSFLDQLQLD